MVSFNAAVKVAHALKEAGVKKITPKIWGMVKNSELAHATFKQIPQDIVKIGSKNAEIYCKNNGSFPASIKTIWGENFANAYNAAKKTIANNEWVATFRNQIAKLKNR